MNRILLVEDDPINAQSLSLQLEEKGYDVTTVDNGEKAIDIAHALAPHLVLMDIYIPGMDGLSITRQLRKLPRCSNVNIIGLTSTADSEAKSNAMRAGCDEYENNPVDFGALDIKLAHLNKKRQPRLPAFIR